MYQQASGLKTNKSLRLPNNHTNAGALARTREYSFDVLMSNYCGKHWNITSGGKSTLWRKNGTKPEELDTTTEGLLFAEKKEEIWNTYKIVKALL